ncbi:MAG TPA: protein-disulfide reductase DsbD domain-containing protein [Candidatus Krumholzibacteria bacterium]|nr:protein-disulfide reductase DsbD domain-containing protein [Candidatus Krumholzibacteria bacterium]
MKPAWLGLAFLLAADGADQAERRDTPAPVVSIDEIPAVSLLPSDSAVVTVQVRIADGFHVQANPASSEFLVPLELILDGADGIAFRPPRYPEGTAFRLEGTMEDLATYHGTITVATTIVASPDIPPGVLALTGALRFQACDSARCLFPATVPVSFDLVVGGAD